jgi:hypothetical protein
MTNGLQNFLPLVALKIQEYMPSMTEVKEDIKKYHGAIVKLLNSTIVFPNNGLELASVVMAEIFNKSKKIVRIYSTDFINDFSLMFGLAQPLQNFLARGGVLQIAVDDETNLISRHQGATAVKRMSGPFDQSEKVEFRKTNESFTDAIKNLSPEGVPYHFALGDDKMFRIETNARTHEGRCSFNNTDIVLKYSTAFEGTYPRCEKIVLPVGNQ